MTEVKSMCSTFFAKTQVMVNESNDKVQKLQSSHDTFMNDVVNPSREFEGKLFAV